jgi:hypothetical protein
MKKRHPHFHCFARSILYYPAYCFFGLSFILDVNVLRPTGCSSSRSGVFRMGPISRRFQKECSMAILLESEVQQGKNYFLTIRSMPRRIRIVNNNNNNNNKVSHLCSSGVSTVKDTTSVLGSLNTCLTNACGDLPHCCASVLKNVLSWIWKNSL